MIRHAFICDAIRTPFGRYGGALSAVRGVTLRRRLDAGDRRKRGHGVWHRPRFPGPHGARVAGQGHPASCYFTMVAIENGRPVSIPDLQPMTDVQARRRREAELRKSARLELSRRFETAHSIPSTKPQETT